MDTPTLLVSAALFAVGIAVMHNMLNKSVKPNKAPLKRVVSLTPSILAGATHNKTAGPSGRIASARANCYLGQTFEEIQEVAEQTGSWKDETFPHTDESLFEDALNPPKDWLRDGERGKPLKDVHLKWLAPWSFGPSKRPLGKNSRGQASWLYHCADGEGEGMDSADVQQGSLGDCYFLSALALAATDTQITHTLVDDTFDSSGIYGVSFWVNGRWTMVWVDAYFPCVVPNDPHSRKKPWPVFASSANHREIWPMVVEKAYAKLHGSWQAIGHGGRIADALQALTGGVSISLPADDPVALWPGLCKAVEDENCLVGAGTRPNTPEDVLQGIIAGHAYSILHALEVKDKEGNMQRLMLLRNPWGHGEWTGAWSDKSDLWRKYDLVKAAVGDGISTSDDGRFWMGIEDFCNAFASVDMCRLPGSSHKRTVNTELHKQPKVGAPAAKKGKGTHNTESKKGQYDHEKKRNQKKKKKKRH